MPRRVILIADPVAVLIYLFRYPVVSGQLFFDRAELDAGYYQGRLASSVTNRPVEKLQPQGLRRGGNGVKGEELFTGGKIMNIKSASPQFFTPANLSQEMLKRLGCKYSDRLLEIYSAR